MKASSRRLSSVLSGGDDTIVVRATPAGRGALAIVRVSGPGVKKWAERVVPQLDTGAVWKAQLVTILGSDGSILEKGIAIPYKGPRSYTGEDMVELMIHGSAYLISRTVEASVEAGCREAKPGEFTRRAVSNGKMDLVQAEGINELIAAETELQATNAWRLLQGELSQRLGEIRACLVEAMAEVEAAIDFAAQGMEIDEKILEKRIGRAVEMIEALAGSARRGERIREGTRVAIVGAPNAGKSTLFNYLMGREKAIVDRSPGTTRDLVEGEIDVGGARVILVDTAGLREARTETEREGVRRARRAAQEADAVILAWSAEEEEAIAWESDGEDLKAVIRVRTKADLAKKTEEEGGWLAISVVSGEGLEALRKRIARIVAQGAGEGREGVAIGRRHATKLEKAIQELKGCDLSAGEEITAERLRWTVRELDELTGEVESEEVLEEVFGTFCLGK